MLILTYRRLQNRPSGTKVILLFGAGLIGTSVIGALPKENCRTLMELPFNWNNPTARSMDKKRIFQIATISGSDTLQFDVIWAAGKAGLAATEHVLAEEDLAFDDVLDVARQLSGLPHRPTVTFHLVSSAGGLFEGEKFVGRTSHPRPLRPYGTAKLRQEGAVSQLECIGSVIYRPSTVYGYCGGGRAGLITSLIGNAQKFEVTTIYCKPDTLRDFVQADDVGRFIASKVFTCNRRGQTYILASAKPTSATEIVGIVRDIMKRPLYVCYHPAPSNALHNSYLGTAPPVEFRSMALQSGIQRTILAMEAAEFSASMK